MAPFYKYGLFNDEVSLIVAFIIGIGFGFFLERAGFGSARKLVAQFYLTDMAVFKVMFSAIVTAMLGVFYLGWMGILDLSLVYLTPTYLIPQIFGGLLLGAGFVIGGYCPGTSVVAMATGKLDGIVYIMGVIAGVFTFGELYPLIQNFAQSTPMGKITLPQYMNMDYGIVVFIVVVIAIVGFIAASWIEKRVGGATS
ncbi:MAG: sulfurtransferase [Gemmatimonadetes bacterium]|nr:MAG: sulfurtransferase [Gemmatimonadota bacterium]